LKRSNHVILVKNLPFNSSEEDLAAMFQKHGSLDKIILPPTRVFAVVCSTFCLCCSSICCYAGCDIAFWSYSWMYIICSQNLFMDVYHLLPEFARVLHYLHYRQCPLTSLVYLEFFFWLSQVVFVEATEAHHAFKRLLYTRYK
jgi:hypothetical protein